MRVNTINIIIFDIKDLSLFIDPFIESLKITFNYAKICKINNEEQTMFLTPAGQKYGEFTNKV